MDLAGEIERVVEDALDESSGGDRGAEGRSVVLECVGDSRDPDMRE